MRRISAWLGFSLCIAGLLTAIADGAQTGRLVFLSTQLRPIEEAQKMRNLILKDFPPKVDYITEQPQGFSVRIKAEEEGGTHTIDVVGALHGELQALVPLDALAPLDDLVGKLSGRGIPGPVLALGKFGTAHQLYIPWMQASYIMVANKKALPFLPSGADINALSYAEAAEAMWTQFASLWRSVNPASTSYNFMQQPLLSGDVWIGFDHVARMLDALRQRPDEFVAFPAPAGPKGRGYMPVLAGLAVLKSAPDMSGAMALIDYLTEPQTQIVTARSVGFFPVVKAELPPDLDPGVNLGAAAIEKMQSAKDALPCLVPIGLGQRAGEFDKVFMDTFRLVVLRDQNPRAVLDREAEILNRLMTETGVPCWQPDPASTGACRVQ